MAVRTDGEAGATPRAGQAARQPSPGDWGVEVRAPGRLSFTLINLDASSARRNGIAAFAIQRPGLRADVAPADAGGIAVEGGAEETRHHVQQAISRLRDEWDGPSARVRLRRPLPLHSGFGSKTTTLLAVGTAYGRLCGREADLRELSRTLGRGGTSGASTGLAAGGGFLVDGGHLNPPGFAEAPQDYLKPSRFAKRELPPVPVVRAPFPDWPVLVLLTRGRPLGGDEELAWFQDLTPIPEQESWRTCSLVFMGLVPAVVERDYPAFCAAVNALTSQGYYKRAQIEFQGEAVVDVLGSGQRDPAIDAIALSVTGPACFAFARDPRAATAWAERLVEQGLITDFWFTNACNRGLETSMRLPGRA